MARGQQRVQKPESKIFVEIENHHYPVIRYFNRYRIERFDDVTLVHVSCYFPGNSWGDTFSCAIGVHDIEQARDTTLSYLDKIQLVQPEGVRYEEASLSRGNIITAANTISSSYSGKSAEIALNIYAIRASADIVRGHSPTGNKIVASPVALLRSPLDVHVEFLSEFFIQ